MKIGAKNKYKGDSLGVHFVDLGLMQGEFFAKLIALKKIEHKIRQPIAKQKTEQIAGVMPSSRPIIGVVTQLRVLT